MLHLNVNTKCTTKITHTGITYNKCSYIFTKKSHSKKYIQNYLLDVNNMYISIEKHPDCQLPSLLSHLLNKLIFFPHNMNEKQ